MVPKSVGPVALADLDRTRDIRIKVENLSKYFKISFFVYKIQLIYANLDPKEYLIFRGTQPD